VSYPYAGHDGPDDSGAVETVDEATEPTEASLLSVLEVGNRLHQRVAEVLGSVRLSHPAYQVLAHLQTGTGRSDVDRLARLLRRPVGELSRVVGGLAGQGLVLVSPDRGNGVPAQVTLTPPGSARALEGRMQIDIVLLDFAARFGAAERTTLRRLLGKVAG